MSARAERARARADRALRRWWPLGAVTGAVMVLALVGVLPRWPGLAHQVALPPLDLFADVRVLMAEAPSLPVFVIGMVAAIAVRVTVLTLLLGRPLRRVGLALAFYAAAAPPALVAAALDFSGRAVLYVYLLWAGLVVTLITFVVLAAAPWTGADRLRGAIARAAHDRLRVATSLAYLSALAVLGLVVRRPGEAIQVVVVPVSAVLTMVAVERLRAPPAIRLPRRTIAALSALTLAVAGGLVAVGAGGREVPRAPRQAGSLLLVAGVDTRSGSGALFGLDPRALGFSCEQTSYFSYAGSSDAASGRGAPRRGAVCPIRWGDPYTRADTLRPLTELSATFGEQLTGLARPVTVVTHSQGAWVAWSALAGRRPTGVRALVMLGPFGEGLAPYPPPSRPGAGAVGGAAVRLLTDVGRDIGFSTFDPDAPLARELQATPGAIESILARPLPRSVRAVAVLSRWDLPLVPGGWPPRVTESCPGWVAHGTLPRAPAVFDAASRFLDHRSPGACPGWVRLLGHATEALGVPPPRS